MRKIAVIACLLLIAGCAAQPAPPNMDNPGFWWGLLHGLVAPFSLIGSFFDPTIRAYAAPNSGWWYDLGFVLGLSAIAGGSGSRI
jgi:hypothetical protein